MLHHFALVFVLVSIADLSLARVSFGSCPEVPSLASFSPSKFAGKWYEIQRLPVSYATNLKCSTSEFTMVNPTQFVNVNFAYDKKKSKQRSMNATGDIKDMDDFPNRFILHLPFDLGVFNYTMDATYDIWASDVTSTSSGSYALVYSCKAYLWGLMRQEMGFILSRGKELSDANIDQLKQVLKAKGVQTDDFQSVTQDCNF